MEFAFRGTETADAWKEWHGSNFAVVDGEVVIAADPVLAYASPEPVVEAPPSGFEPVDLALDECGLLYALTPTGDVYRYDRTLSRLRRLPCTWHEGGPGDPTALAVTSGSIYVVDAEKGRVHAFSRHLLQTRWIATDPFDRPVAAVAAGGTVLVLDAGAGDPNGGFVARLDADGEAERVVDGLSAPADIAVDADGRLVVLAERDGADVVLRYDADYAETEQIPLPSTLRPTCLEVGTEAELLVGTDPATSGERGLFRRHPERGSFEPVPGFTRSCWDLLLSRGRSEDDPEGLYAIADDDRAVVFLEATRTRRLNDETGRYDAQVARRIDSGLPGTQWHRVTTDLDLDGAGIQVRVRYHATDDGDLRYGDGSMDLEAVDGIGPTYAGRLRDAGVLDLSDLIERSPERVSEIVSTATVDVSTDRTSGWLLEAADLLEASDDVRGVEWQTVEGPEPRDALLDAAEGRYLWVELDLAGDAYSTPGVRSFRAYFPRQSYLRHLPAIYRDDEESAAFLERFLSIFESVFVDVEEEIGAATRYLDADGIPAEYLSWLAEWLALDADESWPEPARRALVREAPDLFRKRGTREGLLKLLRLYLEHVELPSTPARRAAARARERREAEDGADDAAGPAGSGTGNGEADWAGNGHPHGSGNGTGPGAGTGSDGPADDSPADTGDSPDGEDGFPLRDGQVGPAEGERLVYVFEHSDLDCIDSPDAREDYERLVPCSQCFLVLVRSFLDEESVRAVERVVASEQPAHAVGRAVQLRPWIQLGGNSFLGVNTVLPEREFVLEEAGLGKDSVLVEREEFGHLERKSRLGTDTVIS